MSLSGHWENCAWIARFPSGLNILSLSPVRHPSERSTTVRWLNNQTKEVAEFNRLEVQLRIYGLEKAGKGYEEETFLLKRINNHIENINKFMAKNVKDNYWTW